MLAQPELDSPAAYFLLMAAQGFFCAAYLTLAFACFRSAQYFLTAAGFANDGSRSLRWVEFYIDFVLCRM
jgi:hypothetical protein